MEAEALEHRMGAAIQRLKGEPPDEVAWVAFRALIYREMYRQRYASPEGVLDHFEEMGNTYPSTLAMSFFMALEPMDWQIAKLLQVPAETPEGAVHWTRAVIELHQVDPLRLEAVLHATWPSGHPVGIDTPDKEARWWAVKTEIAHKLRLWNTRAEDLPTDLPIPAETGLSGLLRAMFLLAEDEDPAVQARFFEDILDIAEEAA